MTTVEHLIENAIYAQGKYNFEEWLAKECRKGNSAMVTYNELRIIWTCASYVVWTLFGNAEEFKDYINWKNSYNSEIFTKDYYRGFNNGIKTVLNHIFDYFSCKKHSFRELDELVRRLKFKDRDFNLTGYYSDEDDDLFEEDTENE